jgi:hypothetical protein
VEVVAVEFDNQSFVGGSRIDEISGDADVGPGARQPEALAEFEKPILELGARRAVLVGGEGPQQWRGG